MAKKELVVNNIEEVQHEGNVYNLHVEDNHNYFADGINVSNCHQYKAKSLIAIMTKLVNAKIRCGTTGTIDDSETHALVLEGLFGKIKRVVTTNELIEKNQLSPLLIKAIVLKYPIDATKLIKGKKYQVEIDYLIGNEKRNEFIRNLAVSLNGNTLLLFNYVERHGKVLKELIEKKCKDTDRKVFYVYGGTDVEAREEIRAIIETEKNSIIVASSGVYSTGVNIKNLHNIIFAHPGKSKIKILQSIGRVLRLSTSKETAILYDIVDDLSTKTYQNYAIKHFLERHKYYVADKFPVTIYKVELKT